VVAAVFPSLDLSFINKFASKSKKEDEEDITSGERESTVMALEMKALELTANPLFGGNMENERGGDEMDEEDLLKAVKTHPEFIKMATSLRDVCLNLQDAKKDTKHSAVKAKASKFKMIVMKGTESLEGLEGGGGGLARGDDQVVEYEQYLQTEGM